MIFGHMEALGFCYLLKQILILTPSRKRAKEVNVLLSQHNNPFFRTWTSDPKPLEPALGGNNIYSQNSRSQILIFELQGRKFRKHEHRNKYENTNILSLSLLSLYIKTYSLDL